MQTRKKGLHATPLAHLLGQVVDAHMVLGGHKKEGLRRVEGHAHHAATVLAEWVLSGTTAQLVHQHCLQASSKKQWLRTRQEHHSIASRQVAGSTQQWLRGGRMVPGPQPSNVPPPHMCSCREGSEQGTLRGKPLVQRLQHEGGIHEVRWWPTGMVPPPRATGKGWPVGSTRTLESNVTGTWRAGDRQVRHSLQSSTSQKVQA